MAVEQNKDRKGWSFFTERLWDIEIGSMSAFRRAGVRLLRVLHLIFKGLHDDECLLHASALTFSTLLSIVPILAFSLAVARGFGAEGTVEKQVRTFAGEQIIIMSGAELLPKPAVTPKDADSTSTEESQVIEETGSEGADEVIKFADKLITIMFDYANNANFGALGGVGLVFLLFMAIQVVGLVEASFNKVWGVSIPRSMFRRAFSYLGVMVVVPILLVAASALPIVEITAKIVNENTAALLKEFMVSPLYRRTTTIGLICIAFVFTIRCIPNTKVRAIPSIVGGVASGLLLIVWLWICVKFQIGVSRSNIIYGSFAAVPIMLAWLYTSWAIVLLGAEIAFAVQNCTTYKMEQRAHAASMESKLILALSVLSRTAESMVSDLPKLDVPSYAREKKVPVRLVNDVIAALVNTDLLAEVSSSRGSYVMLKSPDALYVRDVISTLLRAGSAPGALGLMGMNEKIESVLSRAGKVIETELENLTVRDLIKTKDAA